MRVLMVCWEYPPHMVGGMGKHAAELAPALAACGIDLHVVTPLLGEAPLTEQPCYGLTIYRVPLPDRDGQDFAAFVTAANRGVLAEQAGVVYAQVGGFDLIHTHDWLGAWSAIELKHRFRRPLIATIHATERGRAQGRLPDEHARRIEAIEWDLAYHAWRVVVCSQFMVGHIQECFATPADKIDMIPNGVGMVAEPFESPEARLAFRRRFAADHEPLLLSVGRVVFEKGLHVLLDALPTVLRRYPQARAVVAGTGSYADALQRRAAESGLAERVTFTGFLPDADRDRLYRVADLTVIPSLYEPFGIVALEAMAGTSSVVASATGGLVEVVTDGVTGLLVPPGDQQALAEAIVAGLADPQAARSRAARGLEEVARRFGWGAIAARTAAVYERVHGEWFAGDWK